MREVPDRWQSSFNPWPPRVVWIHQQLHGRRRDRFYWLAMPEAPVDGDLRLVAVVDREANRIVLEMDRLDETNTDGNRTHGMDNLAASRCTPLAGVQVELLLSDALLDLTPGD